MMSKNIIKKILIVVLAASIVMNNSDVRVDAKTIDDSVIDTIENLTDEIETEEEKYEDEESGLETDLEVSNPSPSVDMFVPGVVQEDYVAPIVDNEEGVEANASVPSSYMNDINELKRKYPDTRNQNPYGTCWSHGVTSCAEFSMINQGYVSEEEAKNLDYSELQLAYFSFYMPNDLTGGLEGDTRRYAGPDYTNYLNTGYNAYGAMRTLAQGMGLADESTMPYSWANKTLSSEYGTEYAWGNNVARMRDGYAINLKNNPELVKEAIMENGAVTVSFCYNAQYAKDESYYCPNYYTTNHLVTIVGWDDDYDKSNFKTEPEGNGAWVCRNSWSEYTGLSVTSYFYMSYYDKSIYNTVYEYVFEPASLYDNIYQYDGGVDIEPQRFTTVANMFTVSGDAGADAELLEAVSFSAMYATNLSYKVEIYTDIEDVAEAGYAKDPTNGILQTENIMKGTVTKAGIHRVDLNKPIVLEKGSKFSVIITVNKAYALDWEKGTVGYLNLVESLVKADHYQTYVIYNGEWDSYYKDTGLKIGNACIRAYTSDCSSMDADNYSIKFVGNGNDNADVIMPDMDGLMTNEDYRLSANEYVKKGYKFVGWNTRANGSGDSYSDEQGIRNLSAYGKTVVLYAQWEANSYSIKYDANGGIGTMSESNLQYDVEYELAACGFTHDTKIFDSWNTEADGSGTTYRGRSVVKNLTDIDNDEIVLYAIWSATADYFDIDGTVIKGYNGSRETVIIPDGITEIADNVFNGDTNIKTIIFPDSLQKIGKYCFASSSIKEVNIPDNVRSIGEGAFSECYSLIYVSLPEKLEKIEDYLFRKSNHLENIIIPESVTEIGERTFEECIYITEIQVPESVVKIGDSAFAYCSRLSSIKLPSSMPEKNALGSAFWQCRSLKSVTIPDGVKVLASSMFYGCVKLENVYLPDSIESIESYAFGDCSSLTELKLPKMLTTMNDNFKGLKNLTKLTVHRLVKSLPQLPGTKKITVYGQKGTIGEQYAAQYGYDFEDTVYDGVVYYIQYDSNGGTGSVSSHIAMGPTYLMMNTFAREGYTFQGWNTKQDGSGISFGDFAQVEDLGSYDYETVCLYAQWKPNTYQVSFDPGEGECDVESITVTYDKPYGNLPIPNRPGYKFCGWKNAEDYIIHNEDLVKITEDTVLRAEWTEAEYTVSFDTNGGAEVDSITVVYGSTYNNLPTPMMAGGNFVGWFTELAGGEEVTSETTVRITEDQILYAHWIYNYTVANPIFSISNGSELAKGNKVSISTGTDGAKLYYTLDKSDPTDIDTAILYEDEIVVETAATIKAVAIKQGYNNSEVMSVTYTIKDESEEWGEVATDDEEEFDDAYEIPENFWVRGIDDAVYYSGSAITFPNLRVYHGKKLLKSNTDYTVKYTNNIKVGTATVSINGKGNYEGSIVRNFNIKALDISTAKADDIYLAYNKRVQTGVTAVTYELNGEIVTLKANTDFYFVYPKTNTKQADYDENAYKEVGEYDVQIVGKGNYTGTKTIREIITTKKLISKMKVKNIVTKNYTGEAVIQNNLEVWDGREKLTEGVDYTLDYENNTAIGMATVIIRAIEESDYVGLLKKDYKIIGTDISKMSVSIDENYNYVYDELPKEPTVTVFKKATAKEPAREYELGIDYTITYDNNIKAGNKAAIIIKGINGYSGTIKKTFTIEKKTVVNLDIVVESTKYNKGGAKPKVEILDGGKRLILGEDYTVVYSNNNNVHAGFGKNAPTVKITGKGNYCGNVSKTFAIEASSIDNVICSVSDIVYQNKSNICKPAIKLIDSDGKSLSGGKDYDTNITFRYAKDTLVRKLIDEKKKQYNYAVRPENSEVDAKDIIPAGTEVVATIVGKGNYLGSTEVHFRYVTADISKATINVESQSYTGKEIKLNKDDITIKIGNEILKKTDYVITGYKNNVEKGTAEINIKGVGNYGGIKSAKFKIAVKSMNYTIVYNKNAEDATGTMKNSITALNGKISANVYKRNGYRFLGWSLKDDGIVTINNSGYLVLENVKEYGSIIYLYAQWEKID